jgi:tetratricopeptide (TPR) repeat protein
MRLSLRRRGRLLVIWWGLFLTLPAWGQSPPDRELDLMQIESYDLLEAGKIDQAQEVFARILKKDPGNPLALNNLGALMVSQGKFEEALGYLEQALPRAKNYKVKVNRVCDVGSQCLAFRPRLDAYGDQDLEPLVRLNIDLVKARIALRKKARD